MCSPLSVTAGPCAIIHSSVADRERFAQKPMLKDLFAISGAGLISAYPLPLNSSHDGLGKQVPGASMFHTVPPPLIIPLLLPAESLTELPIPSSNRQCPTRDASDGRDTDTVCLPIAFRVTVKVFSPLSAAVNSAFCGRTASSSLLERDYRPRKGGIDTAARVPSFYRDRKGVPAAIFVGITASNRRAEELAGRLTGSLSAGLRRPGKRRSAAAIVSVLIAARSVKAAIPAFAITLMPPVSTQRPRIGLCAVTVTPLMLVHIFRMGPPARLSAGRRKPLRFRPALRYADAPSALRRLRAAG